MKTTAEMIEVMKAYEEGKQIEFSYDGRNWSLLKSIPIWAWDHTDYRIAEKNKYRPYKDTNEMIDDFCKRSKAKRSAMGEPFIWIKDEYKKYLITSISNLFCTIVDIEVSTRSMQDLFEYYTYLDGSPCGILE